MRILLPLMSFVCFLLAGSIQPSQAEDTSSSDPNAREWAAYNKLDKELTELYQKTLISLDNAKARENLTNVENNWLDFRKAQGLFVSMGAHGNSPDKALMVASFTETTEARIAQLKEWQATQSK